MRGLILSKSAKDYELLCHTMALPIQDMFVCERADAVLNLSAADKSEISWVFAEPSLAIQVLHELPALKWLQSTWAGVEGLLAAGMRRDYALTNVRGLFAPLMTEYVLAHVLAHERQLFAHRQAFLERRWHNTLNGVIRGKTILLFGVGSIGAGMAQAFKALGMRVFGVMNLPREVAHVDVVGGWTDVQKLLPQADYVVNVLPNTPATQNIFDAAFFKLMAQHALFINVGRGQAVVEADLATALQSGDIAGAVLDVYRTEPLPEHHVFWDTPHLTLTSHTAAPSIPAEVFDIFKDNFERFNQGLPLKYVVDFDKGY
ncbi:D-2-hydroxyacid dehydrogenase [Hydromonas duriensis]|uniref:Phosphoglycerate dehydrogenase-like enzyme n=1 Tax=Hydromonas duriensis TaxID=1527608 RepID=A0A4R6YAK7_9BURK|nr:D-2-hydroxyacid dehydrogenase [Hydromonas duriensis]TDR32588.1 phosphoglycerate dehydrogenase-like enzyme [Hydromonas duriensis]